MKTTTFMCCHCGHYDHVDEEDLEKYVNSYEPCSSCGETVPYRLQEGTTITRYINLYQMNQVYGGPEEGGWWYPAGVPIASIPVEAVCKETLAGKLEYKMIQEQKEAALEYLSRFETDETRVYFEQTFAQPFPKKRPHYE